VQKTAREKRRRFAVTSTLSVASDDRSTSELINDVICRDDPWPVRSPLPARIVRVADVFDALTIVWVYKSAWRPEKAITSIRAQARVFDPDALAAFLRLYRSGQPPELASDFTASGSHAAELDAA
jgi:hypothetical protein